MTTTDTNDDPPWPTHPDGRPMKMGEMTPEQRRAQWVAAARRVKRSLIAAGIAKES